MRWTAGRLRAVLAALAAALGAVTSATPVDLSSFAGLGSTVLHGHWSVTYASSYDQAGPMQLVLSDLLLAGGTDGTPHRLGVVAIDVALVLTALAAARGQTLRRQAAVGAGALLWLTTGGLWSGHPVEIAIPLLWLAGIAVSPRRPAAATVLLAASAAIAPWAVLAFPALLARNRLGRAVAVAAAATATAAATYLPFALTGRFALFSHSWPVSSGSAAHLLVPGLDHATWSLRLVQATVVVAVTATAAERLRTRPDATVLALTVAALARVLTDPQTYPYYWLPAAVLLVVGVARARSTVAAAVLAVAAWLAWACAAADATVPGAIACLVLLVVAMRPELVPAAVRTRLASSTRRDRRPSRSPA